MQQSEEWSTPTEEGLRWLRDRSAKGNWLDIGSDEEIDPGVRGWSRTIAQMFQIYFAPEIRRRIDRQEEESKDFFLFAAQLLSPRDEEPSVRLNTEIKGIAHTRAGRPLKKDEPVTVKDLDGIVSYDLPEEELDAGHFTIWWTSEGWALFFDFRPGRAKCEDYFRRALEYVSSAKAAHREKHTAPCIDNLHSACELIATAQLILSHKPADDWRTHGKVHAEINLLSRQGNMHPAFISLFNKLSNSRSTAKYSPSEILALPDGDDINLVEMMAIEGIKSVEQRKDPPSA